MIKSFEQFVLECYNKPSGESINESFQSGKLRELIKQHGKPKYSWENKMLYDLKDDEIVDVLNSREEYWKKYSDNNDGFGQATFMLELKDGAIVVISNLDILKNFWDDMEKRKDDVFKKRHEERHKGNLGKGGDEIHRKHMENVDKIMSRRLAEKLQPSIPEIIEAVKSIMDSVDPSDFLDGDNGFVESEITLDGDEYVLVVNYEGGSSDGDDKYGATYYSVSYGLTSFEISNDDTFVTNEQLGVTNKTHKDLFNEYTEEVEGEIYDYYDYYGVSRSDFV
jgi:hypothetical protein